MRRAGLLAFAALALVVPGPAQAAPDHFQFEVLRNACKTTGGDFHHGEVLLKVRVTENGASGANKFTLSAVAQHHKHSTDTWPVEYSWDTFKVTFPNDGNSYHHTRWFAYDPKDNSEHRIVLEMKVWHNQTVLASKTVTSKSC